MSFPRQDAYTGSCYLNCMSVRNQTFIDRCIAQADQAMRTVFAEPAGSGRVNPAQSADNNELSPAGKKESMLICLARGVNEKEAQKTFKDSIKNGSAILESKLREDNAFYENTP